MDLVIKSEGRVSTTSKIVSDAFGKEHRSVLKSVKELDCSDEFRAHNFMLSSYTSPQNKVLPCYEITRDGFSFLCMGFTGKEAAKWKEAYIKAFNAMEQSIVTIDSRMSDIAIQGEALAIAGSKWGEFGAEIKRKKAEHKKNVAELIEDVQLKICF